MPDLVPWWNINPVGQPSGPDIGKIISAQQMAEKMRLTRQTTQGYNALGAMYADPNNIDQRGNLKPDALSRLMSVAPMVGMEVQSQQLTNAQKQASTTLAASKVAEAEQNRIYEKFSPLYSKYLDALKVTGGDKAKANQVVQPEYTEMISECKSSGDFPNTCNKMLPNFDGDRLGANLMGREGIARQIEKAPAEARAERADVRAEHAEGRAEEKAATPGFVGDIKGEDGKIRKGVPLSAGGPTGFRDAAQKPVVPIDGTVHKMSTKGEEDAAGAGTPTGPAELHGEDYLKALPAARAALVKGYVEGRVPFPGSFSLRSPYWQKMVADITQYDPAFDYVNANARYRTRADFTSGKSAQNITSFNTAIGHLGTLDTAAKKLENRWSPTWNTIANIAETAIGDPRVKEFSIARQAVASELERAFRGTGGNLTSIQEWEKSLDTSGSPEQLRGAITKAVNLLGSRINAVGEQYRRGMGTTADVTELLTPAAKKTLARLPGGDEILGDTGMHPQGTRGLPSSTPLPGGGASAPIPPAQRAAPQGAPSPMVPEAGGAYTLRPGREDQDFDSIPSGAQFRGPDGVKRTKP